MQMSKCMMNEHFLTHVVYHTVIIQSLMSVTYDYYYYYYIIRYEKRNKYKIMLKRKRKITPP